MDSNESVSDQNTQHSAESSFENVIQETRKPLNQFKQQLLIATGRYTIHEMVNIFGNTRHIIEFDPPENLVSVRAKEVLLLMLVVNRREQLRPDGLSSRSRTVNSLHPHSPNIRVKYKL